MAFYITEILVSLFLKKKYLKICKYLSTRHILKEKKKLYNNHILFVNSCWIHTVKFKLNRLSFDVKKWREI